MKLFITGLYENEYEQTIGTFFKEAQIVNSIVSSGTVPLPSRALTKR